MKRAYRRVNEMTAGELYHALCKAGADGPKNAVHQIDLFVAMGGDPNDHDYARLSFLTAELRAKGFRIGSSRNRGLWLET